MFHPDFGGDAKRTLDTLSGCLAIIEFESNGKIIAANENFCRALGYDLAETKGRHHSLFVEPAYEASRDYGEFWAELGGGEFDAREYKRIGKGGEEVWIQASYNPVLSKSGTVLEVAKVATDVTAAKLAPARSRRA
jgi:methyl-accepting chemotaxis protein